MWYFPVTVLEREQLEEAEAAQELEDADAAEHVADAEDAEAAEEVPRARGYAFRAARKQSDHAIAFGLGDVMDTPSTATVGSSSGLTMSACRRTSGLRRWVSTALPTGVSSRFTTCWSTSEPHSDVITYVAQENVRRPADAGKPRLSGRAPLVSSCNRTRLIASRQIRAVASSAPSSSRCGGCWMVEAVVPDDAPPRNDTDRLILRSICTYV